MDLDRIKNFLTRLNGLSSGLLNCQFVFHDLEHLDLSWNSREIDLLKANSQIFPKFLENQFGSAGFPLVINNQCVGILQSNQIEALPSDKFTLVAELIGLVALDSFGFPAKSAKNDLSSSYLGEKVVSLSAERDRRMQITDLGSVLQNIETALKPLDMKRPLLVEAPLGFDMYRTALDIHERTQGWAFFRMEDLSKEVFSSSSELQSLGRVTMFISDLAMLNETQQLRIAEQVSKPDNELQVIAVAKGDWRALVTAKKLLPHFVNSFDFLNLALAAKEGTQPSAGLIIQHLKETRDISNSVDDLSPDLLH